MMFRDKNTTVFLFAFIAKMSNSKKVSRERESVWHLMLRLGRWMLLPFPVIKSSSLWEQGIRVATTLIRNTRF